MGSGMRIGERPSGASTARAEISEGAARVETEKRASTGEAILKENMMLLIQGGVTLTDSSSGWG